MFQPSSYSGAYGAADLATQLVKAQSNLATWKSRIGKKLYPKAQTHVAAWQAKVDQLTQLVSKEQGQLDNLLQPAALPGGDVPAASGPSMMLPLGLMGAGVVLATVAFLWKRSRKS